MAKKLFSWTRTLHAWCGVTLALLLIVVSFTGTLLVWKSEYLWLTIPEARMEFSPSPQALASIGESVEALFEPNSILSMQFATAELPLTYVTLTDNRFAYVDIDGNIIDQWQGNGRAEEWLFDLHHRLLLENTGLTIVGFGAMAMLILVILGLISYWPYRKGFRLGVVPGDTSRLQLLKAHRNLGLIIALPFFMTLMTGIVLVFPEQAESLLLQDMRNSAEYSDAMVLNIDTITGEGSGDWLPALERAEAVFEGATIRSAQVPGDFTLYRILGLQQPGEWNRQGMSRVYIDSYEGYMDIRIDAQTLPAIERAYNTIYPLHTGKINSLLYQLFLTLIGLGVFSLGCVGLFSFIKKYR